jgi:hypothetical protein
MGKGELHLALEGQEEHGIRITSATSLSYVRTHFPVPAGFIFGVPQRLEGKFKATDFLPLMLLRAEDCLQGKLGSANAPTDYKGERDRLEYEAAQLRETLSRHKDEHKARTQELIAAKLQLEGETAALRARAEEEDTARAEAQLLREQKRCLICAPPPARVLSPMRSPPGAFGFCTHTLTPRARRPCPHSVLEAENKELKQAAQRESHRLIAQLADAQRETTEAQAAAASADAELQSLRARLSTAAAADGVREAWARKQRQLADAKYAALKRAAASLRAGCAKLRSEAEGLLGREAQQAIMTRADAASLLDAVAKAHTIEERAAGAAKGAQRQVEAARDEAARARAEIERLHSAVQKAHADADEARADLKALKTEKARMSADARRRESTASTETGRLTVELAAVQAQLTERARELKKARADADAARHGMQQREGALHEQLRETLGQLAQSEGKVSELVTSLEHARAMADKARQAQEELEDAWAETGGRRVSFAEYISLRREVQQLALAGREFFVTPESGQRQQAFLTHVARVETMLGGARDARAHSRGASGSAGGVPTSAPQRAVLSRAATLSSLPVGAAQRESRVAHDESKRRSSLGFAGASVGSGSHLHQMQSIRARRQQQVKPPGGLSLPSAQLPLAHAR